MQNLIRRLSVAFALALTVTFGGSLSWGQEFQFNFAYEGQTWKHTVSADKWASALEQASQACLNHFTKSSGSQKIRVDERTADALLNTCANPR